MALVLVNRRVRFLGHSIVVEDWQRSWGFASQQPMTRPCGKAIAFLSPIWELRDMLAEDSLAGWRRRVRCQECGVPGSCGAVRSPWSIQGVRRARCNALEYSGVTGISWSAVERVDSHGRLVKARSVVGRPGVTWSRVWSARRASEPAERRGSPRIAADRRGVRGFRGVRGSPRIAADRRGVRGSPRIAADRRGAPRSAAERRGSPRSAAERRGARKVRRRSDAPRV
eukprot:gene14008-biopygen5735